MGIRAWRFALHPGAAMTAAFLHIHEANVEVDRLRATVEGQCDELQAAAHTLDAARMEIDDLRTALIRVREQAAVAIADRDRQLGAAKAHTEDLEERVIPALLERIAGTRRGALQTIARAANGFLDSFEQRLRDAGIPVDTAEPEANHG